MMAFSAPATTVGPEILLVGEGPNFLLPFIKYLQSSAMLVLMNEV